jgi:hypothetical protein
VLENLPVAALARAEGPLIAVSIGADNVSSTNEQSSPRVPGIVDTLMRTMTIGSAMASLEALAHADLAIHPNVSGVGFLEWHQNDVAPEAGRIATREARVIGTAGRGVSEVLRAAIGNTCAASEPRFDSVMYTAVSSTATRPWRPTSSDNRNGTGSHRRSPSRTGSTAGWTHGYRQADQR